MKKFAALLAVLSVPFSAQAAEIPAGAVRAIQSGTWSVTTTPGTPATAPCKTVTVNVQGSGGADVAVDATAGGVTVLAASVTRCGAVITNSGAAAMRCDPSHTVTSTVGYFVPANGSLILGQEGQQAWKCIRTTGTSTAASVAEATP